MLPSSLRTILAETARGIGELAAESRWYVFGSALAGLEDAEDLDLLVVYSHGDVTRALRLREAIERVIDLPKPVHLLLLTSDEDHESEFSVAEGAQLVWPSAGLSSD